ncbi:50S ribosomal protein L33 [Patescibacteria group bacterium]|nr:50S ribosomal protein L33 [Patescibacteria group bacterium]MBU4353367.1 50S ribosomal protein L33 [Patescibacteria group bacterium]MBU4477004.1 50S ribosomal protein L33 [Patescibacteria group bacterium]MCG2698825.1 50S ribosomal protein L33 [Candidatus Parcubacteria bacterium]
MAQDNLIKLQCKECKQVNYWSRKNKKKSATGGEKKLELKKFCKWDRKRTMHKEVKK